MIKKVLSINHEYSVRSGVFAGIDDNIYMELDDNGEYVYKLKSPINDKLLMRFNSVDMMSDHSENEDTIAQRLFGRVKGIKHNPTIGYFRELYAGYVNESDFRKKASSGGFGSWLLCELLRLGEIDGVIHPHAVDPKKNDGILFKYQISRSEAEVRRGAKTSYYPMELSEVLKEVKRTPGKYAVVAISDFITELRLLCEQEPIFKERIVYMIGLFNAHQKTAKYAEALAWEQGVSPGDLQSIDFRVKTKRSAGDYDYTVKGQKSKTDVTITKRMADTVLSQWHLGFFKSKFSDFTDNAFSELADITLGDAWLPEYDKDPRGNNIIVVRDARLSKVIADSINEGRVKLDLLSEDAIISSQGMVQHIIHELPYRLYRSKKTSEFTPKKRAQPSKEATPRWRRKIQDLRYQIVGTNAELYKKAVMAGNYALYSDFMTRMRDLNNSIYSSANLTHWAKILKTVSRLINLLRHILRVRTRLRNARNYIRCLSGFLKLRLKIMRHKQDGVIITLTSLFNYGNVIQRYALRKLLLKHGYNFESVVMPNYADTSDKRIFGNMEEFVAKYIGTKSYDSIKQKKYGTYVVGSDQVWRNWYGNDWHEFAPFFLDFVADSSSNKIAYAASFGVDNLAQAGIDKTNLHEISALMQRFNHISVREQSGVLMVEEITRGQKTVDVTLDPTLLLKAGDYSQLINNSQVRNSKMPQVFCYILDKSEAKLRFIKDAARHFDNDFYVLNPNLKKHYEPVEFWLKGFRDANIVITDSFHGTVFAIINHTEFITFSNALRGNSRFEALLDTLGISRERLIDEAEIKSHSIKQLKPIDWKKVDAQLNVMRINSTDWLINAIRNKT